MTPFGRSLLGGVAGALTVTLLNESARRAIPHAPRMDVIGQRALERVLDRAGIAAPRGDGMVGLALAADLASNSLYYSAVGTGPGQGALRRGTLLGLAAGLGAATLPGPLGLGPQPGKKTPYTELLTVAWYTIAGLTAGAVYGALSPRT